MDIQEDNTTVTLNGCNYKIHFQRLITDNNRPTIIFLHDALGSIRQWGKLPIEICEKFNVNGIIYDRAGNGQSDCPKWDRSVGYLESEATQVLPQLTREWSVSNPIVFGHSDGGTIALIYAAIFQCKACLAFSHHILMEEKTKEGLKYAADNLVNNEIWLKKLSFYHGMQKTKWLCHNWVETWLKEDFSNWDATPLLKGITCPTLTFYGQQDEYGTKHQNQMVTKHSSGPVMEVLVDECKHFPFRETPHKVHESILAFFNMYSII